VRQRLLYLAAVQVRFGYRQLQVLLQREGWQVNHKQVYRLDREEGLAIPTTYRKKRGDLPRMAPSPAQQPHGRWSLDFLTNSLVRWLALPSLRLIVDTVAG
jgi:putative transposase